MRDVVARVDDALIDRVFQPFVDWIDDRLAFGTYRTARLFIDLASLAWILAEAVNLAGAIGEGHLRLAVFRGIIVVMGLWALSILRSMFQRTDSRGRGRTIGQPNPLRAGMHAHRATCLFWMAGLLIKTIAAAADFHCLALLAMGTFATASVYIGACTNHPPKRRESQSSALRWHWTLGMSGSRTAAR